MAYTGTPIVRNGRVWLARRATEIQVDTPAWFRWLHTVTSFSYALDSPNYYSPTLRKEKRRHDWYWYAYLKSDNKLHNAYAGRTAALSAARLDHIAQALLQKVRQQHTIAAEKIQDGT